ncbi:hypothetical protein pb186bvf_009953 [Paramecium bursaria]
MNKQTKSELIYTLTNETNHLRQKIKQVFDGEKDVFTSKNMMKVYSDVYNFSLGQEKELEEIYKEYERAVETFLLKSQQLQNEQEQDKLYSFIEQCDYFEKFTRMTTFYYRYLDKSYVNLTHKSTLQKRANEIFNQKFFDQVYQDVIAQFIILLKKQNLDPQQTGILQKVYQKFDQDDCKKLNKELNEKIIEELERIFRDIKKYMEELENQDEKIEFVYVSMDVQFQYINQVFNGREIQKSIQNKFHEIVISSLQSSVIDNLENMINHLEFNKDYDKLKKLYYLIDKMDPDLLQLKKECAEIFNKQLTNQYNTIFEIKDEWQKAEQMNHQYLQTQRLIKMYKDYQKIIDEQFNKSLKILNQLKDSLNKCLRRGFVPIFLRCIDRDLNKAKQEIGEQNDALNNFLIILENYRYKDDIINQYWKSLSQKLLKQRIEQRLQFPEFEQEFLKQMRKMCGQDATEKIQNVLTDYKYQFENNNEEVFYENIYIHLTYLKKDYWPNFIDYNQILLPGLEKQEQYILETYKQKNKNLHIQISNSPSAVTLLTYYQAQRLNLTLPIYHAQVLFYFQYHNNPVYLGEIKAQLKISDSYFEKIIADLQRYNLIIRQDQHIKYNEEYRQSKLTIPIHTVIQETNYDDEEIQINRANIIQALIVKIMKARKKCKIQDLLIELRKKVELFEVDPQQSKQVIEQLIRNDYLERNMNDINELIYKS